MGRLLARNPVGKNRHNYASTNVTTSAWVEIISSVPAAATAVEIFDSSGRVLKLSIGSAGQEDAGELDFYILPGGNCHLIPFEIARGRRLSAKAVDASATTGQMVMNFYG